MYSVVLPRAGAGVDRSPRGAMKCLSKEYRGVRAYHDWSCARGHDWNARGQFVRAGRWCRACAHAIVGTLDGFRAYAADQNGECLSTEYEGHRTSSSAAPATTASRSSRWP